MLEIIKERCHSHAWECHGHVCFLRSFNDRSFTADEWVSMNSIEPDINGRAMNATRKGAASRAAPMGLSP